MAYSNQQQYWPHNTPDQVSYDLNFTDADFSQSSPQGLDFQSFSTSSDNYAMQPAANYNYGGYNEPDSFMNPEATQGGTDFDDEPPLLEELGIDPDRIVAKTLAVLNPFHGQGVTDDANFLLQDADLAGPGLFCLLLGACLLLSGGKVPFGYIYGLAMISCIVMYILLNLMTTTVSITLASVASVLGYCLLPVVGLSCLGIFVPLTGIFGLAAGLFIVIWCALSASRLFVTMSSDPQQRPLVAYPCCLLYGVFALIVIF